MVALRSLSARHLDKHSLLVQELQRSQEKFEERLYKLERGSADCKAGDRRTPKDISAQLDELRVKLESKADVGSVPTTSQFCDLQAQVRDVLRGNGPKGLAQLDKISAEMIRKNDLLDLPSVKQLEDLAAQVERKVNALSTKIDQKANIRDVPSRSQFEELEATVQSKGSLRELQKLSVDLQRKANAKQVPSVQQFSELQNIVASKIDANLVPTIHQVNELAAEMKRKANTNSVVSSAQLEHLTADLRQKANVCDVVTSAQLQDLVREKLLSAAASKADRGDVPTLAQHKELAAVTERKLAFLAAKVQQQCDNNNGQQWDPWQQQVLLVPHMVDTSQNAQQWNGAVAHGQNGNTVH